MRKLCINFSLLLVGILLFTLPQPNFITPTGLPFLAYISFIPLFILVNQNNLKTIWIWGFLYGIGSYTFFAFWVNSFLPMGMFVVSCMYGFQFMILFFTLKLVSFLFKKNAWIVQWIVLCAYEYLKTVGFLGFNYGVSAYSQWRYTVIIQCVELIGVWGLSAIITFPSAWLSIVLKKNIIFQVKKHRISGAVWIVVFGAVVIYGIISPIDYSKNKTSKIALIQINTDPWNGGIDQSRKDFTLLKKYSDLALSENKDIDFVVWSETAFTPRILWHYKYRKDPKSSNLVLDLLNYLDKKEVPFVIGNDDAILSHHDDGDYGSVFYNAALLFRPGKTVIPPKPDTYHKVKLVPFTESFPYKKLFPNFYKTLLNGDTHLWAQGNDFSTFSIGDLTFGTPICFEDTFGYVGREFVNNGAQAFVNLSNDAWSKSLACQYQHLSMAVFRCVENRVPAVRSTSSGQTAIIDPNGKITQMLEPFTENYLVGEIPIMDKTKKTIYTRYGDWVGIFFVILSAACFIVKLSINLISYKRNKD